MRKQKLAKEFGFDRYDKGRLQQAINQVQDKRMYIRLRAVQMVTEGKSTSDIAQLWGITIRVIYHWIKSYVNNHQPQSFLISKGQAALVWLPVLQLPGL